MVTSAPSAVQRRRNGRLPTVVSGASTAAREPCNHESEGACESDEEEEDDDDEDEDADHNGTSREEAAPAVESMNAKHTAQSSSSSMLTTGGAPSKELAFGSYKTVASALDHGTWMQRNHNTQIMCTNAFKTCAKFINYFRTKTK
jgi:hypothetical protein